jgi:hypothetical protein
MSDEEILRELQDPETWDTAAGEILPPVKSARAVVSVAFPRDDFARVSEYAQRQGMKTSEFIRAAALDRVARAERERTVVVRISEARQVVQRDDSTAAPSAWRPRLTDERAVAGQVTLGS